MTETINGPAPLGSRAADKANRKDVPGMSQHSQRTQCGPSRAQIVMTGLSTAASAAGTAYMFTTPGFSAREVVACVMSGALTGLLAARALGQAADRAVAADRSQRAAERAARDSQAAELARWQAAATGLLDAYLTGGALDFGGRSVPDYVLDRLTDIPIEPDPGAYEPDSWAYQKYGAQHDLYMGQAPVTPPMYPEPDLTVPIARYDDQPTYERGTDEDLEPLGYIADPQRPWRAFEPGNEDRAARPEPSARDASVAVPLAPRVDTRPDPLTSQVIQSQS